MFRSWLVIILTNLIFFSAISFASNDSLTIDEAIHEAQIKSPAVAKAEAAADSARWKRIESLAGFLPDIQLTGVHFMSQKFALMDVSLGGPTIVVPQIIPTSAATLDAHLPIFDGFQNTHRFAAARWESRAANLDLQWTKFTISQQVRLKYYKALAAQKLKDVSELDVKTLIDHLNKTQALRRGGAATSYDVLRVSVQLNEAKTEQLQATDNVVLAREALSEAMGLESDDRALTGDLPVPNLRFLHNVQTPQLNERADLEATSDREMAAHNNDEAAGAFWVPKISLGAEYQYYNNMSSGLQDWNLYRTAYQFGIYLNWGLFDGLASIARSREAAAQLTIAQKTTRQAQIELPNNFDFWRRRYQYSTALFAAKQSEVDQAQESVRLASQGYRAGTRTSTELLDSELDLFRARAGVVTAQEGAAEAAIQLELAVGRKIGDD